MRDTGGDSPLSHSGLEHYIGPSLGFDLSSPLPVTSPLISISVTIPQDVDEPLPPEKDLAGAEETPWLPVCTLHPRMSSPSAR